ncbi:MAG: ABC transporter ATP-binding protein [Synergistales bacterium]|nr:ABC transporter ATP-binding protein [Synergistales bacterium]
MSESIPILEIRQLSKHFGGLKAVEQVSFSVNTGEILGLIGPNGAGKTTCFNMISGLLQPTSGSILFNGSDVTATAPHAMAYRGIGRTFQVVKPFTELTVLENVTVALGLGDYPSSTGMWKSWKKANIRSRAQEILQSVGIEDLSSQKAGLLPLGNLRRLEIARALALHPKLLLLDESFSGLRHEEITALQTFIQRIRNQGVTVLLIEHNMKVAMSLSDRIVVLDHGSKLAEGAPQEVSDNPDVVEAYLGKEGLGYAS